MAWPDARRDDVVTDALHPCPPQGHRGGGVRHRDEHDTLLGSDARVVRGSPPVRRVTHRKRGHAEPPASLDDVVQREHARDRTESVARVEDTRDTAVAHQGGLGPGIDRSGLDLADDRRQEANTVRVCAMDVRVRDDVGDDRRVRSREACTFGPALDERAKVAESHRRHRFGRRSRARSVGARRIRHPATRLVNGWTPRGARRPRACRGCSRSRRAFRGPCTSGPSCPHRP
jgi:hypothetical protein